MVVTGSLAVAVALTEDGVPSPRADDCPQRIPFFSTDDGWLGAGCGGAVVSTDHEADAPRCARRKSIEAQNADRARAEIALAHIAQLYAVEKQLRERLNGDGKGLDRLPNLSAAMRADTSDTKWSGR